MVIVVSLTKNQFTKRKGDIGRWIDGGQANHYTLSLTLTLSPQLFPLLVNALFELGFFKVTPNDSMTNWDF